MRAVFSAELRKLRTLRLPWVIAVTAVVGALLIGFVYVDVAAATDVRIEVTQLARAASQPMWFLVIVVAVLASAGEFQHRTIRTTLLAAPDRGRVLIAKGAAAAIYGMIVTSFGLLAASVSGMVTARLQGTPVVVGGVAAWMPVLGVVAVGAVWAIVATALGVLTRSTALAITVLLLWKFVGEALLPVLLRNPGLSAWTPSGAADSFTGLPGHEMSAAAGGALLLAYAGAVGAAAWSSFVSRDPA